MSLLALIVDDEAPARAELRYLLERIGDVEVVGEAASVREALALAARLDYDVVFCDISMPELTGIDAAREIMSWPKRPARRLRDRAPGLRRAGLLGGRLRLPAQAGLRGAPGADRRAPAQRAARDARARGPRRARQGAGHAARRDAAARSRRGLLHARARATTRASRPTTSASSRRSRCASSRTCCRRRCFFRIHRSSIVNLQKVTALEQSSPGHWIVHLSDAEATQLEVARRQTRALKQHLGLRA